MIALQDKPSTKIDQKTLSEILTQASISFGLRDTLTKYGIPSDEKVSVSIAVEDKAPVVYELPPGSKILGVESISKSFRAAIIEDFICPADVPFKLIEKLREVSGLPKAVPDERTDFTVAVKGQDFEMNSSGWCVYCLLGGTIPWWCIG